MKFLAEGVWKAPPKRVTAPYAKGSSLLERSTRVRRAKQNCRNLGKPLPKAKYSLVTDSEPVP